MEEKPQSSTFWTLKTASTSGSWPEGWEPSQRFTRDDINVLMDMFDARDEGIRSLEAELGAKRRALQVLDDFVACTGFVQD